MPSPSRSKWRAYPGSPARTGAAPAARAAAQLGKYVDPANCGLSGRTGAGEGAPRWQWRPPFFLSLWHPSAASPPGWDNAGVAANSTSTARITVRISVPVVHWLPGRISVVAISDTISVAPRKPRDNDLGEKPCRSLNPFYHVIRFAVARARALRSSARALSCYWLADNSAAIAAFSDGVSGFPLNGCTCNAARGT